MSSEGKAMGVKKEEALLFICHATKDIVSLPIFLCKFVFFCNL